MPVCDRPKCTKPCEGDALYCSSRCFALDNDDTPVQPIVRNKINGFGIDLIRSFPQQVNVR